VFSIAALAQSPAADMSGGEVRKIDKEEDKLTFNHADIKNLDMPGMTMVFVVKDKAMLDKLALGDKIKFKAINDAGKFTVTEIAPANGRSALTTRPPDEPPEASRHSFIEEVFMITRMAFIATILLASAAPMARAELVEMVWSRGGTFTQQKQVAAGKFVEVCAKLPAGLKVEWSFEASGPTDFNIHYHVGKEVVFPAKMSQVARGQGSLRVKVDQDYCWMWSNKTAEPVVLKASFQR